MAEIVAELKTTRTLADRRALLGKIEALPADVRYDVLDKFYDAWAVDGYEENMLGSGYVGNVNVAEEVSARIGDKSSRLLDLASGTGLLGMALKNLGFTNIDGLDASQVSLDVSKKKEVYTNYIRAKFGREPMPIENDQYDGVCSTAAVGNGHVLPEFLPDLVRITKPGGYIILLVREENFFLSEGFCDGKLDTIVHQMTMKGSWEFLMKKRIQYTSKEYGYVYVLRVHPSK